MNLANRLTSLSPHAPQVSHRVLPAQPPNLPTGRVFAGVDIGLVEFDGPQPQPGDIVVILKQGGATFCRSEQAVKGLTAPTFTSGCLCQCPSAAGVAFYLGRSFRSPFIMAIDATTDVLSQFFGGFELGYGASLQTHQDAAITVDNAAPNNLYVLDDRRGFPTVLTDISGPVKRGYFTLCTYALTGGTYQFSTAVTLTDPYSPGPTDPLNPATEPDPPAIPSNCLSCPSGIPLITMLNAPARYLSVSGVTITTHTLTLGGVPYARGLVGNIIVVKDSPANKNRRYVIGFNATGSTYELIEFSPSTDAISRVLPLALSANTIQLATVCNRLFILVTPTNTLGS